MARAGRGQPVNLVVSQNIFSQPASAPLEFGDVVVTLDGVICHATLASLATGTARPGLDGVITGIFDTIAGPGTGAFGATNHGALAVTLDAVTSTATGANANVTIIPKPPGVGRGAGGMHGAQHRHGIEILSAIGQPTTPPPSSSTTSDSFILLESGDDLLQESGDPLNLETNNG